MWWQWLAGVLLSLVVMWLVLLVVLLFSRPKDLNASALLRLLPDIIRLVSRLARDPSLPTGPRIWLFLLVVYLLLPFDLVPDFIPILGYADDVIITSLVLRYVVRKAGVGALHRHWPGTSDGLSAVMNIAGLPS